MVTIARDTLTRISREYLTFGTAHPLCIDVNNELLANTTIAVPQIIAAWISADCRRRSGLGLLL